MTRTPNQATPLGNLHNAGAHNAKHNAKEVARETEMLAVPELITDLQRSWEIEVFFDGDCPLCSREIRWLKRMDKKGRILATDISVADFDAREFDLTQDQLMAEIHGRLPDGQVICGVEVFRRLYAAVGWRRTVAVTRWPLIRHALNLGYRIFAKNRLRMTGRCITDCRVPASK